MLQRHRCAAEPLTTYTRPAGRTLYDTVSASQVVWGKSNLDLPYMWQSMEDSVEMSLFELGDTAGLENFQV